MKQRSVADCLMSGLDTHAERDFRPRFHLKASALVRPHCILPFGVAHRDDHEAARHRIVALERELEDARRRAETAEAAARAARETPARSPTKQKDRAETKKERKQRRASPPAAPSSDPRWPPGGIERYRLLVGGAAVVHAPGAWMLLAASPDEESLPFAAFGIALVLHLVITYFVGRACGAPFPANGSLVLMLVTPMILMGLFIGTSDVLWGSVFAEGIGRWVVRGACALIVLVVGGLVSAGWTAEAASSDVGPD